MTEKEYLTSLRTPHIKHFPKWKELEEMYGKYCYIPLDIPVFKDDKLVDWFFENRKPVYKQQPDIATKNTSVGTDYVAFESVDIFPSTEQQKRQRGIWTLNERHDFIEKFNHVYEQIMDTMPFTKIQTMSMWSSYANIPFHRDQTKFLDLPKAFRIMLYDENPTQTLNLIEVLPDQQDNFSNMFTLPRVAETNTFVWNNLRVKHGSTYKQGYRKILIIIDYYGIDLDKYQLLLDRSISKYKQHCLISTNPLDKFVMPL